MRSYKLKLSSIYIMLFVIAFMSTSSIGNIQVNYWLKYIIAALWCIILYVKIGRNHEMFQWQRHYSRFFVFPFILMLIHFPFAYLVNGQAITMTVISRVSSYFLQRCILIYTAILTATYYKKKAIDYTFKALAISNAIFLLIAIAQYGIGAFVSFALSAWKEQWNNWESVNTIVKALEKHDITFAFGFFVLYYLFFTDEPIKKHKYKLAISFLFMWIGFKRIEILSILVCIGLMLLIIRRSQTRNSFKFWILSVGVTCCLLIFVYVIGNDAIATFAAAYGINFNGRLSGYHILANYYDFSIGFIGRGYCFTTLLVNNLDSLKLVHSDILKSFIDYGFIGFVLWVMFYTYFAPKHIQKKDYKGDFAILSGVTAFCIFSIYSMMNYTTDNVNTYFCYQIVYLMLPMAIVANSKFS